MSGDPQIEFLQVWSVPCQGAIDWFLAEVERVGFEQAYNNWNAKNAATIERDFAHMPDDPIAELAMDLCHVAMMYVDLMIRYGVFGE